VFWDLPGGVGVIAEADFAKGIGLPSVADFHFGYLKNQAQM